MICGSPIFGEKLELTETLLGLLIRSESCFLSVPVSLMTERFEPYEIQPEFKYVLVSDICPFSLDLSLNSRNLCRFFCFLFFAFTFCSMTHSTILYDENRIKEARDPKLSNAYNYTIYKEDHTLGNLIRMFVSLLY